MLLYDITGFRDVTGTRNLKIDPPDDNADQIMLDCTRNDNGTHTITNVMRLDGTEPMVTGLAAYNVDGSQVTATWPDLQGNISTTPEMVERSAEIATFKLLVE